LSNSSSTMVSPSVANSTKAMSFSFSFSILYFLFVLGYTTTIMFDTSCFKPICLKTLKCLIRGFFQQLKEPILIPIVIPRFALELLHPCLHSHSS
jgi:hypothetical protein